jgi:hypothetical protein
MNFATYIYLHAERFGRDTATASCQLLRAQLAISQSPGSSRANPMVEGQEIWQHTFKLNV